MRINLSRLGVLLAALAVVGARPDYAGAQRFTAVRENGQWWLKSPDGQKQFIFAVCVVDPGTSWADYDLKNPSYAGFKYYPNETAWAQDALDRLQAWNFNTIGAWSSYSKLLEVPTNRMFITPILHIGSSAGFPWLDMWDPALVKVLDDVGRDQIKALKQDKRVIGYFSDNELGWWRGAVFKWIWDQKTHFERKRVVEFLNHQYGGSWAKLQRDFIPEGAQTFSDLGSKGRLFLRPGSNGIFMAEKVMGFLAARYYSLCRDTIKKYDPDALFLGDRYISNYYPEVASEAGKYCDVVSTNLNPDWGDGGFVHFHLDGLEALTHKPLMVTEYYMTAKENRSGNGNDRSGFPVVQTQAERAKGFENTTELFARNPSIVGAHWFQYYDEPQNGRGDGENYDFGLVDINNKPYDELIDAAKSLDLKKEHMSAVPFVASDVIPAFKGGDGISAPADPSDSGANRKSKIENRKFTDLTLWDRDKAFVPSLDPVPRGDLYATWTPKEVDLALYWHEERFPENFYKGDKLPDSSRTTIEIEIPGSQTRWVLRVNDKDGTVLKGPAWHYDLTSAVSSHIIVEVPASAFGSESLTPGQTADFKVRLISETRSYTTRWTTSRRLAS